MDLGGWMGSWGLADPRTGQVWPPRVDPSTGAVAGSGWVSARVVAAVPAVGRAMGVIGGRLAQMPLTLVEGDKPVEPTPRLLQAPDPDVDYPTWMASLAWDYWLHGNVLVYDTVVDGSSGEVLAAMWLPAERVSCVKDPATGLVTYSVGGTALDGRRVHHVKRRLDPSAPWRGVGVLEQHMRTWAKISDQQAYESHVLRGGGVPSVVIKVPNEDLSDVEAKQVKDNWEETFAGPRRRPAVVTKDMEISPLSWSPTDAQMIEAQKLSRGEVADMFDLDRFWLGTSDGSFNYKPLSGVTQALVSDTLAEHLATFESALTRAWCVDGQRVRFDRSGVEQDDRAEAVAWLRPAVDAGIVTLDEARDVLGFPPFEAGQWEQAMEQRLSGRGRDKGQGRSGDGRREKR